MNYLAHLFLADHTPESIIGNLLGDFVKGSAKEQYSDSIQKGIALHRQVDFYTDSHQVVRQTKKLVSTARRRYAGILLDVFYDHFLAKNWQEYNQITLKNFSDQVYRILLSHQEILPNSLQTFLPKMIESNLLVSYQEIAGIDRALQRIGQRLKDKQVLVSSIDELQANYQEINLSFQTFFPDLVNYVKVKKIDLN